MKRILVFLPLLSLALMACNPPTPLSVPKVSIINQKLGDLSRNCVNGIGANLTFKQGSEQHDLTVNRVLPDSVNGSDIPTEWIKTGMTLTVKATCYGIDDKVLYSKTRQGTIPANYVKNAQDTYFIRIETVDPANTSDLEAIKKFNCYDDTDPKKVGLCIVDTSFFGLITPAQ